MSKMKKYFSLYGILAATIDIKLHAIFCTISTVLTVNFPKILKLLLLKELKPISLYSPNEKK